MDHQAEAIKHLQEAGDDATPWVHVGIAGVHAVLFVADAIRHGLRDIVYEMRD